MKLRPADLRGLARPEGILLEQEFHRLREFLDLFREQLDRITGGSEPTIVDVYAARRCASVIWRYDRNTSDAKAEQRLAELDSVELAWAEQFRGHQVRERLNLLVLQELADAQTFADAARGSISVQVGLEAMSNRDNREKVA